MCRTFRGLKPEQFQNLFKEKKKYDGMQQGRKRKNSDGAQENGLILHTTQVVRL